MVPRQCASPEVLEERHRLFQEGRVAQHEPHLVVPHPAGDKFVYALPSSQSWWTERMRCVLGSSAVRVSLSALGSRA